MNEPITLDEINDNPSLLKKISILEGKNIIDKKTVPNPDGGKIFLYYFSQSKFHVDTPRF
jgi:hypothetical protein